jgi:hypothetical protein
MISSKPPDGDDKFMHSILYNNKDMCNMGMAQCMMQVMPCNDV